MQKILEKLMEEFFETTTAYELIHIKNDKFNRKNLALAAVREPLCPFTQWMR